MMKFLQSFGIGLGLVLFNLPGLACDQNSSIVILEKTEGKVKYQRDQAIKTKTARAGKKVLLCERDKVITFADGKAKVFSKKQDVFLMDANSALTLNSLDEVQADNGNALFIVEKRQQSHSFKVKTKFSTIGVKGTEFLVAQTDKVNQVSMTEGIVDVSSLGQSFELYEKKQLAAYEAYQQQQMEAFQNMKDSMMAAFKDFKDKGENYIAKGKVDGSSPNGVGRLS